MSRRIVIAILVVLILGVLAGTVWLVISRLRANAPTDTANDTTPGTLEEAPTGGQNIVNPTGDDDGDGLSNADESIWGADPKNADTDADGFKDGEEVRNSHNPTIAGPNDILPDGFTPGKEITPIEAAPAQPIAVDQFFEENVNLEIAPGRNLTLEYESKYPEDQRTEASLMDFVYQQSIEVKLPTPSVNSTNILQREANAADINAYVEEVGSLDFLGNEQVIQLALNELLNNEDPTLIQSQAVQLQVYQQLLIKTPVPKQAESVHKLLLGYSELATATYNQAALHPVDPVKALVAINQLELINGQYLPLIEQELNRLLLD
ncbi:MAG: hypothetical protein HYR90_05050 [Candidatus Andersenbacteria bacterium]|nr:hypothetical protein [Candidatus Andersenbacteria bacterium]MBI3250743.1 hypothetical protein [Candidatus Andersenbacteria bacterium]